MNIEELENKIKELQEELEALKNKKENKRWRAEYKRKFCFIDSCLDVAEVYEFNTRLSDDLYNAHNYFKTKEEAQAVADNIKTHIELMELAEELNTESIDRGEKMQERYYLYYDCEKENIDYGISCLSQYANTIYCTNPNFKDEAIKRIGEERLTKYLKG